MPKEKVEEKWEDAKEAAGERKGYAIVVHLFKKSFTPKQLKKLGWKVKAGVVDDLGLTEDLDYVFITSTEDTFDKEFKEALKETEVSSVGKHNNVPPTDFDLEQLKIGTKIELEHTDNIKEAMEIAKDHLSEYRDYYKALPEMEKMLNKVSIKLTGKD
jgi:hypothetical protein